MSHWVFRFWHGAGVPVRLRLRWRSGVKRTKTEHRSADAPDPNVWSVPLTGIMLRSDSASCANTRCLRTVVDPQLKMIGTCLLKRLAPII